MATYTDGVNTSTPPNRNSAYLVKPVFKALHVLASLGDAGRELRLAEIVQLVKLPKATVYKYLKTLCEVGFVSYDSVEDSYWLGPRAWSLGRTVDPSLRVREVAQPLMRELRDRCGETINLGVLNGAEVVYLEMAHSRRALRMHATIGAHDPAYSTSLGKAMLAFRDEKYLARYLPEKMVARTKQTLVTVDALRKDLAITAKRGYAIDAGENEEGAWCVGAPIRDQDGNVIAAISISAVASRMGRELEAEFVRALLETSNAISKKLGFGG